MQKGLGFTPSHPKCQLDRDLNDVPGGVSQAWENHVREARQGRYGSGSTQHQEASLGFVPHKLDRPNQRQEVLWVRHCPERRRRTEGVHLGLDLTGT